MLGSADGSRANEGRAFAVRSLSEAAGLASRALGSGFDAFHKAEKLAFASARSAGFASSTRSMAPLESSLRRIASPVQQSVLPSVKCSCASKRARFFAQRMIVSGALPHAE